MWRHSDAEIKHYYRNHYCGELDLVLIKLGNYQVTVLKVVSMFISRWFYDKELYKNGGKEQAVG